MSAEDDPVDIKSAFNENSDYLLAVFLSNGHPLDHGVDVEVDEVEPKLGRFVQTAGAILHYRATLESKLCRVSKH